MIYNEMDTLSVNLRTVSKRVLAKILSIRKKTHSTKLDNLFLPTIQKCGSQWVSAIFRDPDMRALTGLMEYPQHHYDVNDFHLHYPTLTYVPGLYTSYNKFDIFVSKPKNYRAICVYRDPRNVIVSWVYSMRESHPPNLGVNRIRSRMIDLSMDESIEFAMRFLYDKFSDIRTWVNAEKFDPNVMCIKLEDLSMNPVNGFHRILEFCDICVSPNELEFISHDYSKNKMRDRISNESTKSHYRLNPSDFREHFTESHFKQFDFLYGNLVEELGY